MAQIQFTRDKHLLLGQLLNLIIQFKEEGDLILVNVTDISYLRMLKGAGKESYTCMLKGAQIKKR